MATISDIAKASGVSTATVSYVMNNTAHKVRPRTRQRVLDTIRRFNYSPNVLARGLNGKAVNTIGVAILHTVSSPLDNPYFSPIISGIMDEVTPYRKSINFFNGNIWTSEQNELVPFCDGRCDGLLIFLPNLGGNIVEALNRQSIPFVIIGEGGADDSVSSIDIDNVAAGRDVTRYIISKRHKRIAHFEGDSELHSTCDRRKGYLMALEESGIELDASLVVPGDYSAKSGYERARIMFADRSRAPTAIFAANDVVAYGAIDGLHSLGLRVPVDVSIAGLDGIKPENNNDLMLTTADLHLRSFGSNAAKIILELLESEDRAVKKIVQEFELKTGDTVTAPSR